MLLSPLRLWRSHRLKLGFIELRIDDLQRPAEHCLRPDNQVRLMLHGHPRQGIVNLKDARVLVGVMLQRRWKVALNETDARAINELGLPATDGSVSECCRDDAPA